MANKDGKNNEEIEQDNGTEKIEIFSTEDEKIKSFGELLTNDSSRTLLQILMKEELTALELSKKTGLSLPLVIYHLNKMQDLNVIKISRVGTNVKGQDMKYYKATKFAVVILPSNVSEKAKESKSLIRSFNSIYRFAGIVVAGAAAWFSSVALQEPRSIDTPLDSRMQKDTDDTIQEKSEFTGDDFAMEEEAPASAPESKPEPEPSPEFSSGEGASEPIDESLELERRQIETTQAESQEFFGIIPEDFLVPIIITAVVVSTGIFLELYYRSRSSHRKQEQESYPK